VQLGKGIDHLLADPEALGKTLERGGQLAANNDTALPLHQVERGADHGRILTQNDRAGDAGGGAVKRLEEAEFAGDVVRGGKQRPARRAAEDVFLAPR
jgi:hypothetical protein